MIAASFELAQRRMGGEHLVELLAVEGQQRPLALEIAGHGERLVAQMLLMLLQIGLGDDLGIRDRGADLVAEPGIDAEVEEQGGEDRDDDRRRHRDQAEQQHHAGMQPRAGEAAAALDPEGHQPAGEHRAQQQQDDQVDEKQQQGRRGPAGAPKLPVSAA